jgi:hypothetical protein
VKQSDGTSLWLFSDTFLGTWCGDGERHITGSLHSSSAVVQPSDLSTCFVGAVYAGQPQPIEVLLVPPPGENTSTFAGWLEDSFFIGNALWSYYDVYTSTGPDPLDLMSLGVGVLQAQGSPVQFVRPSPDAFLFAGSDPTFGSATTVQSGYVYAYGSPAQPSLNPDVLLTRVPVGSLSDRSAYQFYAGLDATQEPIWSSDISACVPLYSGSINGITYEPNLTAYLALYTPPFANTIQARLAPNPWGPFSDAEKIIDCYPNTDSQVYCYDAHRHPELDPDLSTLVVSYDTNTMELSQLGDPSHANVYWPRLVEIAFTP